MNAAARFTAPVVLPCDPMCRVLRDAAVDVDASGRIVAVGTIAELPRLASDVPVTRLDGILLPGLVNSHAHTPMTVLRGAGGDLPLMDWLQNIIWPAEGRLRPADVGAGMLLGAVEMLHAGITTSVEMYFHNDRVVESVLAAGMRAVVTPGIIAGPGWERLGSWQQLLDGVSRWIDADGLRFGPGERIELGYGPHSTYTLAPEALTACAAEARARDALLHVHVSESVAEDAVARDAGTTATAILDAAGVLGGRVLAAHAVHLTDDDVATLARAGAAVAHCPGSNTKLASGIARVGALRAAGVPVGLGTDGPASNDDLDLWEELRLAASLARVAQSDAAALTAADALLLATRGGAAAIGRDDIGTLAPGAWADLVHVTADSPAFVRGTDAPDPQLLANLVWSSGARDVTDVWVAGEHVVAGGVTTRVDPAKALADAAAASHRLLG